ncbi:MAG: OmpA family protein [Lewinellaceae bacterium]|nr:OmpA family protein [Phaeodactylibacter sp.]MCB9039821.1 OmpA family protein [Lewinellaceae bacterium]
MQLPPFTQKMQAAASIVLALSFALALHSQNLVSNGGFENHGAIECYTCHQGSEDFKKLTHGWDDLNTNPILCYSGYAEEQDPRRRLCLLDKRCPGGGQAVVQLEYTPRCIDWQHLTKGCSDYLGTTLSKSLEMGRVYELSFWLYIPSGQDDTDPEFVRHIGLALYPKKVRNPQSALMGSRAFLADTAIYDQWFQLKWQVKPLCPLEYIVVGAFRGGGWPSNHSFWDHGFFYVDEIRVREVGKADIDHAMALHFCKEKEEGEDELTFEIPGATCYFESGDSSLSAEARAALDSFAIRAKEHPKIAFTISGHTDSIGNNHESLSRARVESALSYLEAQHQLPRLRFVSISAGTGKPAAGNATEAGRQLNRRVDIRHADFGMPNVIYRQLLEHALAGNMAQAYKTLNIWLHLAPHRQKLLMLLDPRLEPVKSGQRWAAVQEAVRKSYGKYAQPQLAFLLDSLWAEDQRHRTLKYYIENLAVYLHDYDEVTSKWDVDFPASDEEITAADEAHFLAMERIVKSEKWPRISEVGERAAKAAFLIANHHLNTSTLAFYLPQLKQRCLEGEAEWLWYATMYDRLQVQKELPQRYGTQYRRVEGEEEYELFPLEDVDMVDRWRDELGLGALERQNQKQGDAGQG